MTSVLQSAHIPAQPASSGVEWLGDGVLTITIGGVLDELADPALAERFRYHLESPALDTLVLNASEVIELSTRAAVTLLECVERARTRSVTLLLVPSSATTATLHRLGVLSRFTIVPSVRHARVVNNG